LRELGEDRQRRRVDVAGLGEVEHQAAHAARLELLERAAQDPHRVEVDLAIDPELRPGPLRRHLVDLQDRHGPPLAREVATGPALAARSPPRGLKPLPPRPRAAAASAPRAAPARRAPRSPWRP